MITHKNEIEDMLLSIIKNCEALVKRTYTGPEETIDIKLIKSRETFAFYPPI